MLALAWRWRRSGVVDSLSTALPGRGGWRGCVDKAPFIDPHQSVTDRSPELRAAGAACGWDDRIGEGGDSWFVVRGKEGKGREGKGVSCVSVCVVVTALCAGWAVIIANLSLQTGDTDRNTLVPDSFCLLLSGCGVSFLF